MKSLAKELPHPIQRYLLQFTELGNADNYCFTGKR